MVRAREPGSPPSSGKKGSPPCKPSIKPLPSPRCATETGCGGKVCQETPIGAGSPRQQPPIPSALTSPAPTVLDLSAIRKKFVRPQRRPRVVNQCFVAPMDPARTASPLFLPPDDAHVHHEPQYAFWIVTSIFAAENVVFSLLPIDEIGRAIG